MSALVTSKRQICRCYCRSTAQPVIAETDGGFGTFHRVSDDDQLFEEDLQHATSFGLSGRFVSIMRHLRAAKIPYIRFDADGGEIQGVERTEATPEPHKRSERGGSTI